MALMADNLTYGLLTSFFIFTKDLFRISIYEVRINANSKREIRNKSLVKMKNEVSSPYVKLSAIKAIERYGVSVNTKANVLMLKKMKVLNLKPSTAVKKAFKVKLDKSDISVNLASAIAVLEIIERNRKS